MLRILYIASTFKPSCEVTIEPLKCYTLYRVTVPQRIRDEFGIVLGVIKIIALHYLALVREGEDRILAGNLILDFQALENRVSPLLPWRRGGPLKCR